MIWIPLDSRVLYRSISMNHDCCGLHHTCTAKRVRPNKIASVFEKVETARPPRTPDGAVISAICPQNTPKYLLEASCETLLSLVGPTKYTSHAELRNSSRVDTTLLKHWYFRLTRTIIESWSGERSWRRLALEKWLPLSIQE